MGIFGNIKSVFNGFGKPYIKLEFDDNEALLDFQKRMNENGEAAEMEYKDGEFAPVNGTAGDLGAAGDLYLVRDLRTRARKEPGETVSNKNLRFYKIEGEKVSNFNKDIYEKDSYFSRKIDGYRNIYITKKNGNYYTQYTFFEPRKKENYNEQTLSGYWRNIDTLVNINKVLNYQATPYRTDDNLQLLEDRGRADGVIHRNSDNITTFYGWITDAYNKELRQNAFNEFYNERQTIEDKYYSKYQKKLLTDFYTNPTSYKIRLIDSYSGGKTSSAIGDSERDEFIGLLKDSGLSGYGDKYTVIDNRKRAKKEPGELVANKNLSFRKKGKAAENYNKDAYDDSKYKRVVIVTNLNGLYIEFYIFKAITKATENTKSEPGFSIRQGADGKYYKGTLDREIVKANIKDLYNIVDYIPSKKEAYVTNEIYKKYYNNALNQFFDDLKRTIKYYEDELEKNKNNIYKYTSTKFVQQSESYLKEAQKVYNYNLAFYGYKGLGAPGDVYLVTDTRKNPRKELNETAAFKKIDIEKFNINALKALQDSDPLLYEEIKAGIGKTANPYLYNNLDILEFRGMSPTYKILSDYSAFFETAKNNDTLRGFGLNDTKKLISDTCKKHYKDCAKIAAHLKADSKLQTAFNLWHWLHHNIKYEYDRDGREEIRTPLRTWADRERGVDCDCLSVFAWCVLRCLGYNPAFELAAFRNRPQFSHIYLNWDGIIIDRVWFIFNSRPPLITKTELFKIKEFNNLGNLF